MVTSYSELSPVKCHHLFLQSLNYFTKIQHEKKTCIKAIERLLWAISYQLWCISDRLTTAATSMNRCAYLEEKLFDMMKGLMNSGGTVLQRKQGNFVFVSERELFWNSVKYSAKTNALRTISNINFGQNEKNTEYEYRLQIILVRHTYVLRITWLASINNTSIGKFKLN